MPFHQLAAQYDALPHVCFFILINGITLVLTYHFRLVLHLHFLLLHPPPPPPQPIPGPEQLAVAHVALPPLQPVKNPYYHIDVEAAMEEARRRDERWMQQMHNTYMEK